MSNTITVQIKNVYGNRTIYPACPTSQKFANLTGKKTLSTGDIRTIESLGYAVVVAAQSLASAGG